MPITKNKFVLPAFFMFLIAVASAFYLAKYLLPQFLITAYLIGFITFYWKKALPLKEKAIIGIVVSFPLYVLPAWAVTDNLILALSLGTLWGISTGLGILAILTRRPEDKSNITK